jgi:hypothetical membrane protein
MPTLPRKLAYLGYVAPATAIALILLASFVDPQFSWATRSLSSMGESTGMGFLAVGSRDQLAWLLFNGGLFAGGLLGLPFVALLYERARNRLEQAGAVWFGLGLLSMTGVGVAFLESDAAPAPFDEFHFLFAAFLFFAIAIAPWLHASGNALAGDVRQGVGVIWLANLYAIQWVVWIVLEGLVWQGDDVWTFFAVPEFVGAIVVGVWAAWLARGILADATV